MNLFAYLDPGTGSIILQAVIGALLAGLLTIKMYWRRIKGLGARLRRRRSDESSV